MSAKAPRVILRREPPAVILMRESGRVILSREATKGSLSIQGFYCRGAKAIPRSPIASLRLPQDDDRGPLRSGFLTITSGR